MVSSGIQDVKKHKPLAAYYSAHVHDSAYSLRKFQCEHSIQSGYQLILAILLSIQSNWKKNTILENYSYTTLPVVFD